MKTCFARCEKAKVDEIDRSCPVAVCAIFSPLLATLSLFNSHSEKSDLSCIDPTNQPAAAAAA